MLKIRSVIPMKTAKIGYILISSLICVLGLLVVIFPQTDVKVLGLTLSVFMAVFGIIKLIGYFSKDLYRLAFQHDLAFGLLLLTLSAITPLKTNRDLNFLCIIIGIVILIDGLLKLQVAVDSKKFGLKLWWLTLVLALLADAFGLTLLLRPSPETFVPKILMGVSLILEGILNLSTVLTSVKIIKHQLHDKADLD